ncbi:Glycosyl transferase family group 2 [Modestobacter sp. DSM 44400]|uniref:glycosyltransferase family 2 protein n=1 Tax=Modestobacter sp. DSM 44400 TaxID=1550230 RepID=UPI0008992049|nr:glycosyltransferase family 2 protein [Modestobacter sp. DSM 44400]SDY21710.1 Glycosyl transferase family group 2 [Modestobacter sp. DSM 44400]
MFLYSALFRIVGPVLIVAVSLIALRLLAYWWSFAFHWKRYRRRDAVATADLRGLDVPYVRIQVTTRGSAGSTEVILRGIRQVMRLAEEDVEFYGRILSVEVITESEVQAHLLRRTFAEAPVAVHGLVVPATYATAYDTQLKARGLHYAVEHRRAGWNRRPGRCFVVHYDEESVMVPAELRKLLAALASTDKKLLEGPIYYPLEYTDASPLCRAMEANRPVGCFECRHVMEKGMPLHLHGSNLVIEEQFENTVGWDIGNLDGRPLIAEDYVFGMNAFLLGGREVFGWHGCVMLEQPPFSVRSAFKQRHRWIFGVLQGMAIARRSPSFVELPVRVRLGLVWGTRFRIATFALGAVVGALTLAFLPLLIARSIGALVFGGASPAPSWLTGWMAAVGALWLGSVFIGAWYNVADAGLSQWGRWDEICRAVSSAPIAGVIESAAGLLAVVEWLSGHRDVAWLPTPKTRAADAAAVRRQAS